MHSCIYKGLVNHRRYNPRPHEFSYSLFMMYVDLDELPFLFDNSLSWQYEKPGLASFYRKDHYGDSSDKLSTMIRELIFARTHDVVTGPIRLLTHFRYFGHVFNPLSIYYCFDEHDEQLTHVVAEVTNTPWKEQHCYVLPGHMQQEKFLTASSQKDFHVSPFMDMDMNYQWSIQVPGEHLHLGIENIASDKKLFDATISMKKIDLNKRNLANVLTSFPFMTIKIVSAIHFQALKLWFKGIDYVPHPKNS